jgi:hypothetical protein
MRIQEKPVLFREIAASAHDQPAKKPQTSWTTRTALGNFSVTPKCKTPLLNGILEYHKNYETTLRTSRFKFQPLVVCT